MGRQGLKGDGSVGWGRLWGGRSYDLGKMTLPELWVAYLTYPAIQLYFALMAGCALLAAIFYQGAGGILLSVMAAILIYPFVWYGIHRFILHGRWLYRMRWTARLWKRVHFDHHQDPHRLEVLFGDPLNTIPTMAVITLPVGAWLGGIAGGASALGGAMMMTCVYEFFHCIQHLNYKPKSRILQYMKRVHLLHHFHDESGNYGIINFLPDILAGTYYRDTRARPRSPHVFNLGYDMQEAHRYPWVMQATGSPPRDRPPPPSAMAKRV
ncbi:Fatty acid hydroxylase family protein [Granulibacter bethesdensis CGDNIH4]|nr:Fatty acid hydroxylase family protein [Granulibacter bethesdensis CGDNIH4]